MSRESGRFAADGLTFATSLTLGMQRMPALPDPAPWSATALFSVGLRPTPLDCYRTPDISFSTGFTPKNSATPSAIAMRPRIVKYGTSLVGS